MIELEGIFDIVSEDDEIIGQAPRSLCHGDPSLIHRAVHVLVFNSVGALLLQKRSEGKFIQPGKWDTSLGGHLDVGESYLNAAYREMREELGLSGLPLTFLYRSKIRNRIESENITTFLAITDQDIVHDPTEISAVPFWSHGEIKDAMGRGVLTPNFEEEWLMFSAYTRKYAGVSTGRLGLCSGETFPDLWLELSKDIQGT